MLLLRSGVSLTSFKSADEMMQHFETYPNYYCEVYRTDNPAGKFTSEGMVLSNLRTKSVFRFESNGPHRWFRVSNPRSVSFGRAGILLGRTSTGKYRIALKPLESGVLGFRGVRNSLIDLLEDVSIICAASPALIRRDFAPSSLYEFGVFDEYRIVNRNRVLSSTEMMELIENYHLTGDIPERRSELEGELPADLFTNLTDTRLTDRPV